MLPNFYKWIQAEPGPKMIREALKLYGTKEVPGFKDNPVIMDWARELGIKDYRHDSTAWCGLAMAIVAKRAGKEVVKNPLWARNWAKFGVEATGGPMFGDVLVYRRKGGGHVGLYVGEDEEAYHNFGGNQADMFNIVRMDKDRLIAVRRPNYIVQPDNVRPIFLTPEGKISLNES